MQPSTKAKTDGVRDFGKIGDADLSMVPRLADCAPGLEPVEYNVLIIPAVMPEKIGSILIADETREQKGDAMQVGRIVGMSEIAFNYDNWPPNGRGPPGAGDIVWFARYAGGIVNGRDGKEYRMVKDKDIGGIIERAEK